MRIKIHYSGSTGNLYTISSSIGKLLVEAGKPIAKIKKAVGFGLSKYNLCLLSHEHKDHSLSIKSVAQAGIDCYMLESTAKAIQVSGHRIHHIQLLKRFNVKGWTILPFPLVHDTENAGFLISDGEKTVCYATDTAYIKPRLKNIHILMIECNFNSEILKENVKNGTIHPVVKRRVNRNHFSLDRVLDFLKATDLSRVKEIHLIHISSLNGNGAIFKQRVQAATGIPTYIAKGDRHG